MDKTLEEIVAGEIVKFAESELVPSGLELNAKKRGDMEGTIAEMLREYAEDWAADNAHDWMIDHAP